MPTKIGYIVVGSSGEAEGFSAKTLELHSPTVPGWQTPKFCSYPQELVIRLNEPTRIKKLQLLSHQFMIPSKVEFYVGNRDTPESFKRLGYIYLSNNEKTGFKSRELKSVHVDAEGQYVRILVHKNHLNKFNAYNQACIMAFNVIGDSSLQRSLQRNGESDPKQDYISPMDDLAFDMYQDPEVAEIIRRLDKRKKQAVRDENFDVAKRMKQAIADLQKVGEKLARYELDKRRAIDDEDYDLAKSKKAQMEDYRLKVYQQLQKYKLLEDAGISPRKPNDQQSPLRQNGGAGGSSNNRGGGLSDRNSGNSFDNNNGHPNTHRSTHRDQEPPDQYQQQNADVSNFSRSPTPPPHSHRHEVPELDLKVITDGGEDDGFGDDYRSDSPLTAAKYDDKVIPALTNKNRQNQPSEYPEYPDDEYASPAARTGGRDSPAGRPNHSSGPEAMSEKNIREAAGAIDVFGLPLVAGAYSKTWSYREDTLLAVYKLLNELPTTTPKDDLRAQLKAALFLVRRSIRDKVHSVFHASLRLLELILVEFIPRHKLGKAEASRAVTMTLPNLILKSGETNVRPRQSSMEFVDTMSSYPTVQPTQLVPQHLLQPFKKDTANRLALSRVEMVERMLNKLGLEQPAISVFNVMKFAVPALEHASGQVREVATRIILQAYRLGGEPVKTFLPPDDNRSRRNPLYRNLFDGFDRIDGKPTQNELKVQERNKAEEEDRRKKQEIEELQSQVNQLRVTNNKLENLNSPRNGGGGGGKGKPKNEQAAYAGDNDDEFMDKMCIFCGEYDDSFDESGLDMHYWKNCPMLKRCEYCKQVVEIPLYGAHLLNECEKRKDFGKCPRCGEVMPKDVLAKHVPAKKCAVLKENQEHCPMCNKNIEGGEQSWKRHLMGSHRDACANNPRRQPHIQRLQAKQGGGGAPKPRQAARRS